MIKAGKVKEDIKGFCDNESCNLVSLLDEFIRIYNLSHPVAGKGENIPENDKPEETFEFKPSRVGYAVVVYHVQQVPHSRDEQDVSDLMRYQAFCSSMLLNGIYRHCQAEQCKCQRKTKYFE
jgi:hypothetical protein